MFPKPFMAIITLTTDLGISDFYLAAAKGDLYTLVPGVNVVDVAHEFQKFDILRPSFILAQVWRRFPKGTVHIVAVDSLESERVAWIAAEYEGHFFVGADNGMFSFIAGEHPEKVVQINRPKNALAMPSFPLLDAFTHAAAHLAKLGPIEDLGRPRNDWQRMLVQRPPISEGLIRPNIIYIDTFGNLITNLTREVFDEVGRGAPFEIQMPRSRFSVKTISTSYLDVPDSSPLALFGHTGFMEIAISRGSAARLIGLRVTDTIRIEFYAD
jgi:S-adenosylmethionine hydrolase